MHDRDHYQSVLHIHHYSFLRALEPRSKIPARNCPDFLRSNKTEWHYSGIELFLNINSIVIFLVVGLESQRTNAQLWCLYLEFSSWHMSHTELDPLCFAALKNAQSYDLFWTVKIKNVHKIFIHCCFIN